MGLSLTTPFPYQLGSLVGLIAGLLGAYYNRSLSTSIPFTHKKTFLQTLNKTLSEMGYQQQGQLEDCIVYQKSQRPFSGKLLVKIEDKSATIIGRSGILNILGQNYKNSTTQEK